jgi:hypothetical protein
MEGSEQMSYPQGPQYGQPQGSYPQPGGYPQYPHGMPPKKNNTALLVTFAGIAAAAVIALVLVLVLGNKDDDSSTAGPLVPGGSNKHGGGTITAPGAGGGAKSGDSSGANSSGRNSSGGARDLAERTAKAFEHLSASEINEVTCSASVGKELGSPFAKLPASATIEVTVKDVQESGSDASARMTMSISGNSNDFTLKMRKDADWCVSGVGK